jgi:protein SCO1/2
MLCSLELNGLVDGLKGLRFTPGDEFTVVTVSFDARETAELAAAKKRTYLESLSRPSAEAGWHFLTGSQESIDALTRAVGFSYEYDKETDQYAHAAVVVLATPRRARGEVPLRCRVRAWALTLGLLEALEGEDRLHVGALHHVCYHYDARSGPLYAGRAVADARRRRAHVLVLGCVVGAFWMRDRRHRSAG